MTGCHNQIAATITRCLLYDQTLLIFSYGEPSAGVYNKEQEWRSGESTRLPPMWPGFDDQTWLHMWAVLIFLLVLYSERFFSRYSGFPLFLKLKPILDLISVRAPALTRFLTRSLNHSFTHSLHPSLPHSLTHSLPPSLSLSLLSTHDVVFKSLNDEDKIRYLLTLENETTSKIVGKYTYLMFQKRKDILNAK